ncbi:glycoside hydrolase family 16 protein [Pisolithus orientalis]|uniref:glycoside hydrolase family 16 protein n=1 Tax=Pisolithus orientalis TaxID=936130 RepID=UPI002224D77E|nr:glycoside hydrolase family 16 protein [Pisolithus orientalis]KAI6019883.1 glycoside hydrolase family 16 protein [Pisolithus orientalis]
MFFLLAVVISLAAILPPVLGTRGATCNATTPCSSDYPCCSEYGFCGNGYYCLGGCDPISSHSLNSCKPNPICHSANYTLSDTSRILSNYTYFNDWVVQQGSIFNATSDGEPAIALTLTENNGGTLLSSTRYVHYGRITARLKTGRWAGVVTAFITMSSLKDEIDWEFPGNATTEGQTNYFWQGVIPQTTNGVTETGLSDTYSNWHDFTVGIYLRVSLTGNLDTLTFLVDGNVTRTVKASDCVNNATGVTEYPNTPSRIQLSLWPAGISTEPQGTIQWAGGMINWNDPDYVSAVQCNDTTPMNSSVTSYVYGPNVTLDTPVHRIFQRDYAYQQRR